MPNVEGARRQQIAAQAARSRRLVLSAVGVSSLGDGMWTAAVPLAAAAIDRSAASVAAVSAVGLLPWLVVAPIAGALVDRWPTRRVLVLSDLLRAAVIALLVVTFATHAISVPILAFSAFLVVSGSIFHGAAQQSLVADLTEAEPEVRDTMNARMSSLDVAGASLVGPPVGSVAYAVTAWLPFLADAVSFAFSSICLAFVRPQSRPRATNQHESVRAAIRAGGAFLLGHRELRTLALLTGVANLTTNCALVVLVLYAADGDGLDLSPARYGLLIAALAVGGVVAGPIAPRALRRWGARKLVMASLVTRALVWPAIALTDQPFVAGIALMVAGMASTFVTVTVTSARQQLSPREMLGRVVTAFRTIGNGAAPLGALLGGALATLVGLRGTLLLAGGILALASVVLLPRLMRSQSLR
ncbi:MFS transporter [Kribbella swartbergensis]